MRYLIMTAILTLLAMPGFAERLYVHLTATEHGDDVTVEMTLPLGFVSKAADFLSDVDLSQDCHLRIDGHDFDLDEMQDVARALRRGEEDVVIISHHDELRFRRNGTEIEIIAEDHWDKVVTRMPAELFFAAFSDEERIDLAAALRILERRGGGELFVSSADEGSVRVWIDRSKTIRRGAR